MRSALEDVFAWAYRCLQGRALPPRLCNGIGDGAACPSCAEYRCALSPHIEAVALKRLQKPHAIDHVSYELSLSVLRMTFTAPRSRARGRVRPPAGSSPVYAGS